MGNKKDYGIKFGWLWAIFLQLALICFLFGAAIAAEQITPVEERERPEYIIGLGDVLEVMVWKEADLTRTLTVRIDGRISVPLIGDVMAAGKSTKELKKILEKRFSELIQEPAVSVILVESKSNRYYIIGMVAGQGEYFIDFPITVLQAIGRAGGFTEWAKVSKISIFRRKNDTQEILKFDYNAMTKDAELQQDIFVESGDTIVVP